MILFTLTYYRSKVPAWAPYVCALLLSVAFTLWPLDAFAVLHHKFTTDQYERRGPLFPDSIKSYETYEAETIDSLDEWLKGDSMTGNWLGTRKRLARRGVRVHFILISEFAGNPTGGKKQGATNVMAGLLTGIIDFGKLTGNSTFKNWRLVNSWVWGHGKNHSQNYVGSLFLDQMVYGERKFGLFQLFLKKTWNDNHYLLKFGRYPTGDDFFNESVYWNFQNNALTGTFAVLPFTSFPFSTWGLTLYAEPKDEFYVQSGVFEVPTWNMMKSDARGLDWSFRKGAGISWVSQTGWKRGSRDKTLTPGNYNIGLVCNWTDRPEFTGYNMRDDFAWGGYLQANQKVYTERGHSGQGLTLFGALIYSPDSDSTPIPLFIMGGAVYVGVIPGRDNDILALGCALAYFSKDLPPPSSANDLIPGKAELDIELNYKVSLTKFLYVKPNLQYIANPSGGAYPDAFVVGCELGITF